MVEIAIDIETTSPVDLPTCGVYVYAAHPQTDIICAAYSVNGGAVQVWRHGEPMPDVWRDAVFSAWNAQFERVLWEYVGTRYGWPSMDVSRWRCTMAVAASKGLPLHLADCAKVLGTEHQKDLEGHALMKRVSKIPVCDIDSDDGARLIEYCKKDVLTERSIALLIGDRLPPDEQRIWEDDQKMNDVGIRVDEELVHLLAELANDARRELEAELYELTGGQITSLHQHIGMQRWLASRGVDVGSVRKEVLAALKTEDETIRRVIEIRREGAKSSVAKLLAMIAYIEVDGRMRGLFQYHGASTGRWAGRGPQLQNFPRTTPEPSVDEALWEGVDWLREELRRRGVPVLHWISSALRSCVIPSDGASLYIADYSQIETRMLAWLAREPRLLRVFERGADAYVAFASSMYGVPEDAVTKEQRQVAKSAVLGLGYSMGAARYQEYAATYGVTLSFSEALDVVDLYRGTFPAIPALWRGLENAALRAVHSGSTTEYNGVRYFMSQGNLICRLPSGRHLTYWRPEITGASDWPQLMYWRRGPQGWEHRRLFGGLLAENVVQALSRDVLCEGLRGVTEAGFCVIGTVHDEVLAEAEPYALKKFLSAFRAPKWARGVQFPVDAREAQRWSK